MTRHTMFSKLALLTLLLTGFAAASVMKAKADPSPGANTYDVATTGITVPALPTDLACLEVTSGVVQIIDIKVNGHAATTSVTASVQVIKRSTLNTGGTPTSFVPVPRKTGMAAATAVLKAYTVVPTPLGTTVGLVDEEDALIVTGASTTGGNPAHFVFNQGAPLTISGTEAICIAVPSTASAFAGASLEASFRIQQ
jgi:hypothetical protein